MPNLSRLALIIAVLLASSCSKDKPAEPAAAPAVAVPAAATPAATAPAQEAVFSREELDQMLAPVALYPDSLLAQVLMATTYPGDVADAAKWSDAHPDAKGDAAVGQVAEQPWDPSVQALVAFPQALATLSQDAAWVQRMGDAFLAQPDAVMDSIQRLRRQAQASGNLTSNEYQNVSVQAAPTNAPAPAPAPASSGNAADTAYYEPDNGGQTIIIEPADPEVVYVPSYNPTVAYGTWPYASYPPTYYPPPRQYYAGNALLNGMAFGVGVAITDSLWGGFDWDDNDIDIDINHYNNVNVNRRIDVDQDTWRHNPVHRDGVPYRDQANRDNFSRRLEGADKRDAFRGDDDKRAKAREQARNSMDKRGVAPAASNRDARDSARKAVEQRQGAGDRMQGGGDRGGAERTKAAAALGGAGTDRNARDKANSAATRDNKPQLPDRNKIASRDVANKPPQGRAGDAAAKARQQHTGADSGAAAQARQQHAGAGKGAAAQARQQHAGAGNGAGGQTRQRPSQDNSQVRQAARTQQNAGRSRQNSGAFEGARAPSQSRAQASRGQSSHAAAKQRPAASRPAGKPVQRPSNPPQRQAAKRR